jgi:ribosomal protein S1
LIVQVDSVYTGFIVNEQKASLKANYKVGQKINAVILDIDFEKKIIDLSEKLHDSKLPKSEKATI